MHFNLTVLWTSGKLAGAVTIESHLACADQLTAAEVVDFLEFHGYVGSSWTRDRVGKFTVLAAVPVLADLVAA